MIKSYDIQYWLCFVCILANFSFSQGNLSDSESMQKKIDSLESQIQALIAEQKKIDSLESQIRALTAEVLELRQTQQTQQQEVEKIGQKGTPQQRIYDDLLEEIQKQNPENEFTRFYHQIADSKIWVGGYMDICWQKEGDFRNEHQEDTWDLSSMSLQARTEWNTTFSFFLDVRLLDTDRIQVAHAYANITLADWLNFKVGILRLPFGRHNTTYAAPKQTVTQENFLQEYILPSIWSEPGIAIFGKLYPEWVQYELMLSSGMGNMGFAHKDGNRNAMLDGWQGHSKGQQLALRMGITPKMGTDTLTFYAGVSGLLAQYDSHMAYHAWAVDGLFRVGPFFGIGDHDRFEIRTEYADFRDHLGDDASQNISRLDSMQGYYLETMYAFFPENWRQGISFFTPETEIGMTLRYSRLNFHKGIRQSMYTLGIHFCPIEPTILRLEYSWIYSNDDWDGKDDWQEQIMASFATFF